MKRKTKSNNIFCLESIWSRNIDHPRQSVLPLLDTIKNEWGNKFTHFNCNTREEFEYNLKMFKSRYGILYLAFHGEPGVIVLPSCKISLEEISDILGEKAKGSVIHLASCSTLNIDDERLREFKNKTKASIVSGYTKDVYWIQTASVDLSYLDNLLYDKSKAVENLYKSINPSEETIGFKFV